MDKDASVLDNAISMTSDSGKNVVHQRKRRPSLRQLAEKIGVSHTAVARALRNDPVLSANLRERIHQVAKEEGYFASDTTQGLITGWTGMIGVVLPRLATPYVSDIAEGITDALWEDGTVPLILCSQHDVGREEKMLETLARKRVSGAIVMPCREDRDASHFIHLLHQHTPIIAIDTAIPQIDAPVVTTDNDFGATQVTQHLIDEGHQHIVHLGSPSDNKSADRGRALAYEKTMRKAGLDPHVIDTPLRRYTNDDIVPLIEEYFATPHGRKTTAVFAFSDPLALCVYHFAHKRGLTIGRDLAVAGFGNVYMFPKGLPSATSILNPTLTSVEQYPNRLGETAVQVLRKMVKGDGVPPRTLIKPKLCIGASSVGCKPTR